MSLLAFLTPVAIGLHLHSAHIPERDYQNNGNTGLYLAGEKWQAGVYENTIERTTVYAAYKHRAFGLDWMLGAATGYQIRHRNGEVSGWSRSYVTPMAGVSYLAPVSVLGLSPRIFFAPAFGKHSNVLHFSVEHKFK